MFTGIVEECGTVRSLKKHENLYSLRISANKMLKTIRVGDSVAVNGACLTVTRISNGDLVFDLMRETIEKTNLGNLEPGQSVNLERALQANGRLDGHFVSGHIDCVATVKKLIKKTNYVEIQISLPKDLRSFIISKGSVCIDGVSLTVGEVSQRCFSVYLIPHTLAVTTLGQLKNGSQVNIETDLLAKYVLNYIQQIKAL